MTPAQLRAYSAVVRLGSVRAAAAELGLSDAGVSMHVAALRKELDDPLFTRTGAGLAFTPGGLRLASRAVEILGLQQQTAIEVTEAAHGRRLLRIAASSAFAEHAAPGLIELFSSRADDLSVELSVHPPAGSAN
ncbi:LysR family transcriptional regulator [Mycobacterium tuberculosis]|nr:LysR family transcriptional regulator [Mycobacterium tuberculosis]